jgi:uncharacterized cofD-like protein
MLADLRKPSVVVIGGGTGTHTVLTGLKKYSDHVALSAIVAMTDSGGSTGRLRDEFGCLPVGDVRLALVALAAEVEVDEDILRRLFLYRFAQGDMKGHTFGNLFLVALTEILGSEEEAIRAASRVLRVAGEVVPVTTTKTHLVARYTDGREVTGEHEIDEPPLTTESPVIESLSLSESAALNPRAAAALAAADLVVIGPGDLYTSLIPNTLVSGFKDACQSTQAPYVYIANLMTKWGQTTGMTVGDHVRELTRYAGRAPDYVVVNVAPLPDDLLVRYAAEGEYPVQCDPAEITGEVIETDLLAGEVIERAPGDILKRSLIRHDPDKLAILLRDRFFSTESP